MTPSTAPLACPRCGADRVAGPECPRCGVIYAKARGVLPRPAAPPEGVEASLPPAIAWRAPATWDGDLEDARAELLARALVPPVALGVAWLLVASPTTHMLARTFLTMWIHELGHAVSAWLCGYGAFPGPWRTPVSAARVPLVPCAVLLALGWIAFRGWRERRWVLVAAAALGLAAHAAGLSLSPRAAQALITFGGDGGGLVLGALLVATFYAGPESQLRRGALRWGFVGIGAASLVDVTHTWARARADRAELPLGEIEGVRLSDASKLTDVYGWTPSELTGRYLALAAACLVAIAVLYVVGVVRARARVRECEAGAKG
jgi:hypothetical protein